MAFGGAAALLAAGFGSGFIHEQPAKTPQECLDDLMEGAKQLPPEMAASFSSAVNAVDAPEIKALESRYSACTYDYEKSKQGVTLTFGWK